MPKITEMFPSKYLKAEDFGDEDMVLTIKTLEMEEVGKDKEDKWILYFEEFEKGLVLNKTNTKVIAGIYGDDTDEWEGKLVTSYTTEVEYQGETVLGVRFRKKAPKPKKTASVTKKAQAAAPEADDDEENDEALAEAPF